ncbi:MAG: YecA family protein [Acidimicrobiales bacterium]
MSEPDAGPLATAIQSVLGAGPLPFATLVDRLIHVGALAGDDLDLLADEVQDALLDDDDVWLGSDDVVALIPTLLDGVVFTHRLSDAEREAGVLHSTPDLDVIDLAVEGELGLADGGRLVVAFAPEHPDADEHGSFVGPPGWLDSSEPIVAVTQRAGIVSLLWTDQVADGTREAAALRRAFDGRHRPGVAQEPTEIVLDALASDPSLFRHPVAPVGELLESVGLERLGAWFGLVGEAAEPPGAIERERRVQEVASRYSFDHCCRAAFERVTQAWLDSLNSALAVDRRRAVARDLAHSLVAPAFVDYVVTEPEAARLLEPLAASLAAQSGSLAAPGRFLLARVREAQGRGVAMEAALRSAVAADAGFEPALKDLAWCACDRSDAELAQSLLGRITMFDVDEERAFMETAVALLSPAVGRNDPCPCGSGRKYKMCCSAKPRLALERRVGWIQHKLLAFALRPQRIGAIFELLEAARTVSEIDEDQLHHLLPLLGEIAALGDDAITDFLNERGPLLPADEVAVIETWRGRGPSLYQVSDVEPAEGVTLFDTRSAESVVVHDVAASESLEAGDYVYARTVRIGPSYHFIGVPITVTLAHRSSLLSVLDDPTPIRLAMWMGSLFAQPEIVNREGETMILGRALFDVSTSPAALTRSLDALFDARGDGHWAELIDVDGDSVVRSFINLEGDTVEVLANSRERLDRTVATIGAIDGVVLRETEASLTSNDSPVDRNLPLTPPEMADVLAQFIAEREKAWLDESIPALGGLTPREAAADPTRREDLIVLLNEFDRRAVIEPMATFDVGRLRRALDIE